MRLPSNKYIQLLFACVTLLLGSCKEEVSNIPKCEVYVKTSFSEYQKLLNVNNAVIYSIDEVYPTNFRLGYAGICIFRDLDNNICCCDLACPYECLRSVVLEIKMPYATCQLCGSKFDLSYGQGNPLSGPATCGLKMYTKHIQENRESGYILVQN